MRLRQPEPLRDAIMLAVLVAASTMVLLDTSVVFIAAPVAGHELGASLGGLEWVTNGYLLAVGSGILLGGRIADRFGRRKTFLLATCGFVGASIACGLASSVAQLIGARTLQGACGALLMPSTLALLRVSFREERLPAMVATWIGASSVGLAAGPVVGGVLIELVSWRAVFLVNVVVGIGVVIAGRAVLEESRGQARDGAFGVLSVALSATGLASLLWAMIEAQHRGWDDGRAIIPAVVAFVGLGLLARRERRARISLLPLGLLRSCRARSASGVIVIMTSALFGATFLLGLFLQRVQDRTPLEAGVVMAPLALASVLGAALAGRHATRMGGRATMTVGMLCLAAGLASLARLEPSSGLEELWPALVLMGAGAAIVNTTASQVILMGAPREIAGAAGAFQEGLLQIGAAFGAALASSIMVARVGAILPVGMEGAVERVAQGLDATAMSSLDAGAARAVGDQAFADGLRLVMTAASAWTLLGAALAVMTQQRPASLAEEPDQAIERGAPPRVKAGIHAQR